MVSGIGDEKIASGSGSRIAAAAPFSARGEARYRKNQSETAEQGHPCVNQTAHSRLHPKLAEIIADSRRAEWGAESLPNDNGKSPRFFGYISIARRIRPGAGNWRRGFALAGGRTPSTPRYGLTATALRSPPIGARSAVPVTLPFAVPTFGTMIRDA
jgi:hypothetical protein